MGEHLVFGDLPRNIYDDLGFPLRNKATRFVEILHVAQPFLVFNINGYKLLSYRLFTNFAVHEKKVAAATIAVAGWEDTLAQELAALEVFYHPLTLHILWKLNRSWMNVEGLLW